jgi:hypothetical protein
MYSDVIVQNIVYVIFILLEGFNVVYLFYHSSLTIMLKNLQYLLSSAIIKIYEKSFKVVLISQEILCSMD